MGRLARFFKQIAINVAAKLEKMRVEFKECPHVDEHFPEPDRTSPYRRIHG